MKLVQKIWSRTPKLKFMVGLTFGAGVGFGYVHFKGSKINKIVDSNDSVNLKNIITNNQIKVQEESEILQQNQEITQIKDQKIISKQSKEQEEIIDSVITQQKLQQSEQNINNTVKHFNKLKDIAEWSPKEKLKQQQLVLIVADIPYNEIFQSKILTQVNFIAQSIKGVKIIRQDIHSPANKKLLSEQYKAKIKKQTLFLLKNNYENALNNIDFDMFVQFPRLLQIYLKQINIFDQNVKQLTKSLQNLKPHQSCVLYLYDKNQDQIKRRERMVTAKYIEMEMFVNNLTAVKMFAVDKSSAVSQGLIDQANSRTNSLHLFRKHNIYTPFDPNFYLKVESNSSIPFYRLPDIALFAKGNRNLMIPSYLSSLQIFDSSQVSAPFICSLTVDRNRITDEQYTKLLKTFGQLKRENIFPEVGFTLRLNSVPYAGSSNIKNKEWQITLANLDEIDQQSLLHEIKTHQELNGCGYKQETYLRESNQYLYEHSEIKSELLKEFIKNSMNKKIKQHFKSQQNTILSPITKLNGDNFQKNILSDQNDHFVYEYSQFCPTCKQISPLVGGFADLIQQKGLGLQGLQFHRIDANKNRAKDLLASPYIPNIYYFKKDWKKNGPVRFSIQMLAKQGALNLYNFCSITKQLITVEWQQVDQAINSANLFRVQQFLL